MCFKIIRKREKNIKNFEKENEIQTAHSLLMGAFPPLP